MTNQQASKPSTFLAIISFLVPAVGIILYAFWKNKYPTKADIILSYAIAGFIVNLLFLLIRHSN